MIISKNYHNCEWIWLNVVIAISRLVKYHSGITLVLHLCEKLLMSNRIEYAYLRRRKCKNPKIKYHGRESLHEFLDCKACQWYSLWMRITWSRPLWLVSEVALTTAVIACLAERNQIKWLTINWRGRGAVHPLSTGHAGFHGLFLYKSGDYWSPVKLDRHGPAQD